MRFNFIPQAPGTVIQGLYVDGATFNPNTNPEDRYFYGGSRLAVTVYVTP